MATYKLTVAGAVEQATALRPLRIALVNMPFAMADRPSIQCGLLKSALTRAAHEVDVLYLNVEFAADFGARLYRQLSAMRSSLLVGDWLFSVAAFGKRPGDDPQQYRRARPSIDKFCEDAGLSFEDLGNYRDVVLPSWIMEWGQRIDWRKYEIVGFTSTFEQNTAAFALARVVKHLAPGTTVVFGGANFDGDMGKEYVRALPFIDYAVVGEGDVAFPALAERVSAGGSPIGIPGVIGRSNGSVSGSYPSPLVQNMDALPDPDYDEYFGALFTRGQHAVLETQTPLLLFETSRGCWWGEKQHCTFCGLNNNGMRFRAKSASEALNQLRRLARRYKIINFEAVDNIMDHRYLDGLCEPLSHERFDYRVFYEVKANLTAKQLRTMARAGVRCIQPGIESLSTHVLALMRKGITVLRNVRCLKWALYYKMSVGWNLLTGFPGETEEDYKQQCRIIPLLRHLPPPEACGRIWLERFSPYFFDPAFPVENVRPATAYQYIYPQDLLDLSKIAYFFDYEMRNIVPEPQLSELTRLAVDWKEAWSGRRTPELVYQRAPDWIQIVDRRTADIGVYSYHDEEALIYECCCETDRSLGGICEEFSKRTGDQIAPSVVRASLAAFCERGLMLEEEGRFLSLALPVNSNW